MLKLVGLSLLVSYYTVTAFATEFNGNVDGLEHDRQMDYSSTPQCPPWSYYDTDKKMCNHDIYYAIHFKDGHTYLRVGYCMTYENDTGIVAFSPCPYSQSNALSSRWEYIGDVWYM